MNSDLAFLLVLACLVGAVAFVGIRSHAWRLIVRAAQVDVANGNRSRAISRLEVLRRASILNGIEQEYAVVFLLTNLYLSDKRYADTVDACRRFLSANVPAKFECEARKRLADALDGLGKTAEAEVERETALAALRGHGTDYETLGTQGQLLERQNRFTEAYEAYEQGLERTPRGLQLIRIDYMTKLMFASTHTGQREKALQWAEMAIANGAVGARLAVCHRQAGIGCKSVGRIEDAETHYRKALTLAEAMNRPSLVGKALALLASLESHRGRTKLAFEYADKAIALCPEEARTAYLIKVECLRVQGRFAEAKSVQELALGASVLSIAHLERRSQGIMRIGMAWLAADMLDVAEACARMDEARDLLRQDEMLRVWCDATSAWVLAVAGDIDGARTQMAMVKSMAMRFPDDRNTQLTCCSCPGRGAFLIGEYATSQSLWRRYLELTSSKAWAPLAHHYLGECALAMGDRDEAIREFALGASYSSDVEYARRCRVRKAELSTAVR